MKFLSWLGGLADNTLPALVCVLTFIAGYMHGGNTAEQEGEARIAALQAAWSEQERSRAEAAAAAEKSARERLAEATERGNRLATELTKTTRALDAARADLNKRIRDVSEVARRDCAGMSLDWVRLYNEALGLTGPDAGHSAGSKKPGSGSAADTADTSGAAHARLQQDALATPEDVLEHIRDYGGYCRKLEAGYQALIFYYDGAKP